MNQIDKKRKEKLRRKVTLSPLTINEFQIGKITNHSLGFSVILKIHWVLKIKNKKANWVCYFDTKPLLTQYRLSHLTENSSHPIAT